MVVFKDASHMYELLEDLWTHIVFEVGLDEKMRQYEVSFKFVITKPDGYFYVDSEKILSGKEANRDAVITMELSGDTTYKFWTKELPLPLALATRKIITKGPINKVLKILPSLKPVYELFPEYCKKHNVPAEQT